MRCVEIKISGGDSAHRARMLRKSSRIWKFPDGVERVITLQGWHWAVYDEMVDPDERKAYAASCFEMATVDFELEQKGKVLFGLSFEEWVQRSVLDCIRMRWDLIQSEKRSNDNGLHDLEFLRV